MKTPLRLAPPVQLTRPLRRSFLLSAATPNTIIRMPLLGTAGDEARLMITNGSVLVSVFLGGVAIYSGKPPATVS